MATYKFQLILHSTVFVFWH